MSLLFVHAFQAKVKGALEIAAAGNHHLLTLYAV
jgi:predicted ATPase with chaperone activity